MKPKETEEEVTQIFKEAAAKILQTDYKHLKSGRTYTVSTVALREADLEPLVVYRNPNTGVVFCRPLTEFQERFEERPQGVYNRRGTRCQSAQDGECFWKECPQLRDGEPERSGRHCPLDIRDDNDD